MNENSKYRIVDVAEERMKQGKRTGGNYARYRIEQLRGGRWTTVGVAFSLPFADNFINIKTHAMRHRLTALIEALPIGSQKRIANKLGISQSTVCSILNGKQNQDKPQAQQVIRLAEWIIDGKRI